MIDNNRYIDRLGTDLTEWMISQEQISLFVKLCEVQDRTKRPLKECYMDVIEALNIEAQIKGKPKRAFYQAGQNLN